MNHTSEKPNLTKNQSLVLNSLLNSDGPMSAYSILDALRDDGFKAPLQVYRALDQLMKANIVHKLESLNAYVACSHPACENHGTTAFAICDNCKNVDEITDKKLTSQLKSLGKASDFALVNSTVELRGICKTCQ